jgi:putative sterol carrier protein
MRMFARVSSRDRHALATLDDEYTKFQFNLKGEKPFFLIANNKDMKLQIGTAESPDSTFITDVATFYKIFSGELSQDEAFINKKIEVSGSMLASAKFRRLANTMLASHKTSLKFLRFCIRIVPL